MGHASLLFVFRTKASKDAPLCGSQPVLTPRTGDDAVDWSQFCLTHYKTKIVTNINSEGADLQHNRTLIIKN